MNVQQMQAVADLTQRRAEVLAQLTTTARAAALTLNRWQALGEAVAEDGSIGSRWPEAEAANEELIAALGEAVPGVLDALSGVVAAAQALQAAGLALDPPLDLLPGLPR